MNDLNAPPTTLGDFFDVILSGVDKKSISGERPVKLCNYTDVYHNREITHSLSFMEGTATPSEIEKLTLRAEDVVITKDSETPNDIAVPAYVPQDLPGVVCAYHLAILRPTSKAVCSRYVSYLLQEQNTRHYFFSLANGATRFGLTVASISGARLSLPALAEQQAVSSILDRWDRAIELVENLIEQKRLEVRSLLQRLFRGNDSQHRSLSSVLQRVNMAIVPEPSSQYREIGIRSHGKGLFHKEPVIGRSLGDKRVYRVKPNCFVFNVVFAWEQAVARTTELEEGMIASHRFPMYEPVGHEVDIDYLLYFFKTPRGKHLLGLASPGGAGRNRTLSQEAFMKLKIPLPEIDRQRLIARALAALDREIEVLDRLRNEYEKQKKGLMQQLLTGRVRVVATEGVA
jgi:restriction endonuclease S subunit